MGYFIKMLRPVVFLPISPWFVKCVAGKLLFGESYNRPARIPQDKKDIKKILIIRMDGIGDLVMTTPFIKVLRKNFPDSSIEMLVPTDYINLLEKCPYIDKLHSFPKYQPGFLRKIHYIYKILKWGIEIKKEDVCFDLAIIPRWDVDNYYATYMCYFSNSKIRIGYSEKVNKMKEQLNKKYDLLLNYIVAYTEKQHEVEKNIDIIKCLTGETEQEKVKLWFSDDDLDFVSTTLSSKMWNNNDSIVTIAPWASSIEREWPLERFKYIAQYMIKRNKKVVIIGEYANYETGNDFESCLGDNCLNMAGLTTLRQAGAIIQRSCLFVGNDSGPMHIASATGTPIVEISSFPANGKSDHPNSPKRFEPYNANATILQPTMALKNQEKMEKTIDMIEVKRVVEAIENIFNKT